MTSDLDIYRSANLLVNQHGRDAPIRREFLGDTRPVAPRPEQAVQNDQRRTFAIIGKGKFYLVTGNLAGTSNHAPPSIATNKAIRT